VHFRRGLTWHLRPGVEDQFDEHWQVWLDGGAEWKPFFDELAADEDLDLLSGLRKRELLSDVQAEVIGTLRRSAEGRAVQVPGEPAVDDELVALLAEGNNRHLRSLGARREEAAGGEDGGRVPSLTAGTGAVLAADLNSSSD
jgi:hypothetical protein